MIKQIAKKVAKFRKRMKTSAEKFCIKKKFPIAHV